MFLGCLGRHNLDLLKEYQYSQIACRIHQENNLPLERVQVHEEKVLGSQFLELVAEKKFRKEINTQTIFLPPQKVEGILA